MSAARFLVALLALLGAAANAAERAPVPATTEIGTLDGAAYRIDIPREWNRGLVVFYHGYAVTPVTFEKGERISPMFDGMLARGFAVLQSAYSATGWAVEEGVADTERLRKAFVAKHGNPKETYLSGMSMGGTLIVLALEENPALYDGALSLCGVLEPTDRLMQRDFALRAAFDRYFPDVLGPLVPVPADFAPTDALVAKVAAAMQANPAATRALLSFYGVADAKTLPDVIVFDTYEILEMQRRARGNPFGNADLIYTGSGDDFALNDGVRRYRPDAAAALRMARFYTPTGRLEKPLLALHDTGDPLVPASTAFDYALATGRLGRGDRFVQQFVDREGHCVFTPDEIDRAFGELLDWTRHGRRPASGKLE
ncbi:MAG TPA: alpha/beta hydrolase [Rhodanobacteraceae bacterium]|nr:alpha/beta hydrolase [Rhodanobacteraceae bacterium]